MLGADPARKRSASFSYSSIVSALGNRSKTVFNTWYGSLPFIFAVTERLYSMALALTIHGGSEEPVLPPDRKLSNRPLYPAIINLISAATHKTFELRPFFQQVIHRNSCKTFLRHFMQIFFRPSIKLIQV